MNEINETPLDSQSLKQAIQYTQDEIRTAVMDGNSELLIDLDSRFRKLNARLFGVEVAETKAAIDKAESEKISIAKQIEILREIKKQKNLAAGRAEQLFFRRMERVADTELQIEMANNCLVSARVAAKESKAKLQALLDAKQKETTRQYERYELSQF